MDRGAWRATVRGVAKSQDKTEQLSTRTHTRSWNIVSDTENLDHIRSRQGIAIQ